jgi:hypothetical protein
MAGSTRVSRSCAYGTGSTRRVTAVSGRERVKNMLRVRQRLTSRATGPVGITADDGTLLPPGERGEIVVRSSLAIRQRLLRGEDVVRVVQP